MTNYLKPPKELRAGFKDPARMKAIHEICCSLCYLKGWKQTTPTEAHHLHGKGMGKKVSDLLSMSLCRSCHTSGEFAFHKIGRIAWEEKFEVDQEMLIEITNKMLKSA